VLVLQNADLQAQLNRHTSLAFADPFSVGLKDREDLIFVGNGLAQNHPAADMVDLARRMDYEAFNLNLAGQVNDISCTRLG